MKTVFYNLQTFYVKMSILVISLLPFSTHAQSGENDATFNKPDKIAGQGADKLVEVTALQADGKIIIAGEFMHYNGANVSKLARLKPDGSIDNSFNAKGGPLGKINAIAVLPNNKILVAGNFTAFDGIAANGIVRLNANGSVDKTFSAAIAANKSLFKIILQPDGKIVLGGNFLTYSTRYATSLIRLNKNGSLDNSFHPESTPLTDIQQIQLQSDGKFFIAGTELIGSSANYCGVIRLNQNGERDSTFKKYTITFGDNRQYINSLNIEQDGTILVGSVVYVDDRVYQGSLRRLDTQGNEIGYAGSFWMNSTLIQNDGKILVIGFKYVDSDLNWYILKRSVVRLNKDLSIDPGFMFDDKKIYSNSDDASFKTASLLMDGKILIAGAFTETCGLITNNLARLNPNGDLDVTFNQRKGFNGAVLATAVQGDEKLVVGGTFSRFNYQFISNITRLKKNGEIDPSFQVGSGTNGRVNTVAIQSNGKILIGGSFTSYDGHSCSNIARLNKNGSFDESFAAVKTDNTIHKIGIDRNGKILIAGDFKNVNDQAQSTMVRIFSSGALDSSFHLPLPLVDPRIILSGSDFVINNRGQIYIAINTTSRVNQIRKTELLRLQRNGSIDNTFQSPQEQFYKIQSLALNNDEAPIIGGLAIYHNVPRGLVGFVAQLDKDGNMDSTFHYENLTDYLSNSVRTITVLENDKLIIGGDFAATPSTTLHHIALLNKDGSIDNDISIHADNGVYTTTRVPTDQLIIAGSFGEYNSAVRNGIARINIALPALNRFLQSVPSSPAANEPGLNVYPNPASASIHIENLKPESYFKIFNAVGKEIYSGIGTDENNSIDISGYLNGFYFIVSESDGKRKVSKFIVNN